MISLSNRPDSLNFLMKGLVWRAVSTEGITKTLDTSEHSKEMAVNAGHCSLTERLK